MVESMNGLLNDAAVVQRVLDHVDNQTSDLGDTIWREPVANYHSAERFAAELALLKHLPVPFCPSVALPEGR